MTTIDELLKEIEQHSGDIVQACDVSQSHSNEMILGTAILRLCQALRKSIQHRNSYTPSEQYSEVRVQMNQELMKLLKGESKP